jgi:predicted nucleic acid-binding protein
VILADTSAWVEYDRATGSPAHHRLRELIDQDRGDLAVTDPVVMEVLAGARDVGRERDLRRLMTRFELLPFRPTSHFDGAVKIYRTCRQRGVTPRGLLDCLIAAVAQGEGAVVLAHDVDLARIADVMDLALDEASLRA